MSLRPLLQWPGEAYFWESALSPLLSSELLCPSLHVISLRLACLGHWPLLGKVLRRPFTACFRCSCGLVEHWCPLWSTSMGTNLSQNSEKVAERMFLHLLLLWDLCSSERVAWGLVKNHRDAARELRAGRWKSWLRLLWILQTESVRVRSRRKKNYREDGYCSLTSELTISTGDWKTWGRFYHPTCS